MKPDVNDKPAVDVTKSRLKFIAIILLFFGPLGAAFLWYYGFDASFAPRGQANNAPLISPAISLAPFSNNRYDTGQASEASLERKWTIVHIINGTCDHLCTIIERSHLLSKISGF